MKTKTEMPPIYKRNRLYHMLRYYVDCMIRNSYNTIAARGKDNIPDEGIIIIAPNHSNALMDPLLILQSSKKATLFGARADVFTPAFRKALHFLKIVPMIRRRNGFRNVVHNIETIETITEALGHGMPFCMFCEGTHRTMHSLLPLTKGIARIACEAYRKESAKAPEKRKPVYIIPAGIEYADYFRFRHSAVITFGRPIEITDTPDTANTAYMCNPTETGNKTYIQVPPDIKKILATLHTSMSQLITYLPDDREYDRKFTLLRLHSPINEKKPAETLENNRKHAEEIELAIAFDSLAPMLDRFEELRQKTHIIPFIQQKRQTPRNKRNGVRNSKSHHRASVFHIQHCGNGTRTHCSTNHNIKSTGQGIPQHRQIRHAARPLPCHNRRHNGNCVQPAPVADRTHTHSAYTAGT